METLFQVLPLPEAVAVVVLVLSGQMEHRPLAAMEAVVFHLLLPGLQLGEAAVVAAALLIIQVWARQQTAGAPLSTRAMARQEV